MAQPSSPAVRHLTVAQALYVGGSTVDLTLTGIVGARLAPAPSLATMPFSAIFVAAGLSTFVVSRAIGRVGHRTVFVAVAATAAVSGCVSALAIQTHAFWLFCVGTALIGVYGAGAGYYRYLAAESMPDARARAVTTVLAGGLVAALVGPFLATAVRDVVGARYVASYLLVAALGTVAAGWNLRLRAPAPAGTAAQHTGGEQDEGTDRPRTSPVLWRQPTLLLGVVTAVLAAGTMITMMTAGPILGLAVGHTAAEAAFAIQLHMVGMYAPGFLVARVMGRVGERRIAVAGAALIVVAGLAAASSTALPAYLAAMFAVGVGWNLAYSGGTALITASYARAERGRVQPVAEALIIGAQVGGSFAAAGFTGTGGWHRLGGVSALAAAGVGAVMVAALRRSRSVGRVRSESPAAR